MDQRCNLLTLKKFSQAYSSYLIMSFIDYFFSGNKYIRVSREDTGPGSVDAEYPQPITNWQWPGGFGKDGIDAALYSGSKCYFFKGKEYVRVTRNGTVNAGQQDFTEARSVRKTGARDYGIGNREHGSGESLTEHFPQSPGSLSQTQKRDGRFAVPFQLKPN